MKLSVVIVSYNVRHYVSQCLRSVCRAIDGSNTEVFVVDNHSTDDTVAYLRDHFPWVNVVDSPHNLGFARANNIAIRQSHGDYVLLLNPDTIVGEDVFRRCVEFMDQHPKAGGLGVKMLKTDGQAAMESRRGLPTPMTAFYKVTGLCHLFPQSRWYGRYYMGWLSWDEPAQIEVVSGAFCLLRRAALDQVGLLDEDFFMYGEDIDLSCRLLKGGWQNWYLPVSILHYKGESTQKTSFRYVHVFYDAMLIFFRKHYGHLSLLVSLPVKAAIYAKAFVAFMQMLVERARRSLGFVTMKVSNEAIYIFCGDEQMLDMCRQMTNKYGLKAEQYVKSSDFSTLALPYSHSSAFLTYIVFDVYSFNYQDMFHNFQSLKGQVSIGTFDTQIGTLVTAEDVMVL